MSPVEKDLFPPTSSKEKNNQVPKRISNTVTTEGSKGTRIYVENCEVD